MVSGNEPRLGALYRVRNTNASRLDGIIKDVGVGAETNTGASKRREKGNERLGERSWYCRRTSQEGAVQTELMRKIGKNGHMITMCVSTAQATCGCSTFGVVSLQRVGVCPASAPCVRNEE